MSKPCNFAIDVVDKFADVPSQKALYVISPVSDKTKTYTFDDIAKASRQVANILYQYEIKKTEKVFLMMPNIPEWWIAMIGLNRAGIIPVPATSQLSLKEIKKRFEATEYKAVLTVNEFCGKFAAIQSDYPNVRFFSIGDNVDKNWLDWNKLIDGASTNFDNISTCATDPALLYFTSGTTSFPKMVMHNHAYTLAHKTTGRDWLGLDSTDLHWCITDPGWAKAAWSTLYGPWHQGACVVCCQLPHFEASLVLNLLEKQAITSFCAAPTAYRMLVKQNLNQYAFPHLRSCVSAGEPLNPQVISTWKQHFDISIRDGYGQTETIVVAANFIHQAIKPGSMGKANPEYTVKIVDDDGSELPVNTEGNLAISIRPHHPQGLFKEYWGKHKHRKENFIGDWYLTGDRAKVDLDGYLWFLGRDDDVMIPSGYRVGPFEVESVLIEHPSVAEAGVVAKPHAEHGQCIKAYCLLSKGYKASAALAQEIIQFSRTEMAHYKCPTEISFVESLPKTVSGKIKHNILREWAKKEFDEEN